MNELDRLGKLVYSLEGEMRNTFSSKRDAIYAKNLEGRHFIHARAKKAEIEAVYADMIALEEELIEALSVATATVKETVSPEVSEICEEVRGVMSEIKDRDCEYKAERYNSLKGYTKVALYRHKAPADTEVLNAVLAEVESAIEELIEAGVAPRTCSHCGAGMFDGYVINGGDAYYCSDECLHIYVTPEEYEELYDDGEGDSYWTEWELGE